MYQYFTFSFFAVKYSIVCIYPILFLVIDSMKRGGESWQRFHTNNSVAWVNRKKGVAASLKELGFHRVYIS